MAWTSVAKSGRPKTTGSIASRAERPQAAPPSDPKAVLLLKSPEPQRCGPPEPERRGPAGHGAAPGARSPGAGSPTCSRTEPSAQCLESALPSHPRSSSSRASTRELTHSTSELEPLTQQKGSCGPSASSSAERPSARAENAARSSALWRLTASRKRKAGACPPGSCCVRWRCRKTRPRSCGLEAMRVKWRLPKRNSSALRVIQKKWASFSGSAAAAASSSSSEMSEDISDRKGVMPTPAPTATRTERDRALCAGAA
mmetsp:Transcript_46278/g.147783  ORF Transcript_46278/g.147783 Transcript_46278/m.147783 type:complete len:257 (-) Transcript_46278:1536-2306(-)